MRRKSVGSFQKETNKNEINAQISEQTAQISKKDTKEDFRNLQLYTWFFSYITSWVWFLLSSWPILMLVKHARGLAYSLGGEIGHFRLLPEEALLPISQNFSWCSQLWLLSRKILQAEDPPDRILIGSIFIFPVSVELQSAGAKWNSPWQSLPSQLRSSFLSCVSSSHTFCQWGLSAGEMVTICHWADS